MRRIKYKLFYLEHDGNFGLWKQAFELRIEEWDFQRRLQKTKLLKLLFIVEGSKTAATEEKEETNY